MKINRSFLVVATIASFALSGVSFAGPKTYQVTGPVLAVTDTSITVQKGEEKWEVVRDGKTKITGEVKVGAKVTIEYTMNAVNVEAKAGADAAKPVKPKGK